MSTIITRAELVAWSKGQVPADDSAQLTVDAVNAYVSALPVVARLDSSDDGQAVPESVKFGALLLANRAHRRRMSPNGIESMSGESVAYVARYDPDIARFLELDRPSVG